MLTKRQKQAIEVMASGYSIDECAEIMHISRSTVEKTLQKAKIRLEAVNLTHAIYKASKIGLIAFCCFAVFDADEVRRVSRIGRRELVLVQAII